MSAPRWAVWMVRRASPPSLAESAVGDLEEAHRRRVLERGRAIATVLTALESIDLTRALLWDRFVSWGVPMSWIDFKLGLRMLVRYPGLTVLGGLAMAFGICVGTASFELMRQLAAPKLPFEDGERIVGLYAADAVAGGRQPQILRDFLVWRDEMGSVDELGAYRTIGRNLASGSNAGEPAGISETTASAFRVTAVRPVLGRTLVDEDERVDAPAVAVLSYDAWQRHFRGGSDVVGRAVRLGDATATVVGVMPEGYAFPLADLWMPLRLDPLAYPVGASPAITVFGRLAADATLESAQAELTALGERAARDSPQTHARLRPRIASFPQMYFPFPGFASPELAAANLFILAVIVLLGANVALLMFARSAAREGEMTVRSALGAGRRRIVGQLFAESLVLAGLAAVLGIAAAKYVFGWGVGVVSGIQGALPFWITSDLSAASITYGVLLTLVVAAVAGVFPGLQATARPSARLREATTGGGGVRFGGVWSAVIVLQVALTVIFPAFTLFLWQDGREALEREVDEPAPEIVVSRLEGDGDGWGETWAVAEEAMPLGPRYAAALGELERRLDEDPGVRAVGFVDLLPRAYHYWNEVELDAGAADPLDGRGHRVARAEVRRGFFQVFDAPIVSGRPFDVRDEQTGAPVVIVDEPFVQRVLGGRNPIGRLVRYVASQQDGETLDRGPWYEIVGVVGDLGLETGFGDGGIYHVVPPGTYPAYLVMRATSDPRDVASRLRGIAARVDPSLQLQDVTTLDDMMQAEARFYSYWTALAVVLTIIILLLSLAGTYSVTSFMVSRRTREIGLRVALGGNPLEILRAIMRRPIQRVLGGIVVGSAWVGLMVWSGISTAEELGPRQFALLAAYAVVMLGVCLLACVVPARRALAVEPRDALAADG